MHKLFLVAKVKTANLRYTQQGKAVFNVKVADFKKDKNDNWHGANFELAYWGDVAERAAQHIEEGKVYVFVGEIDEVKTFEMQNGNTGTSISLSTFTSYNFLPGGSTVEDMANSLGGTISNEQPSEAMGFGD